MLGRADHAVSLGCRAAIVAAALALALVAKAQTPTNPLRPSSTLLRIDAVDTQPSSVVPRQFGQPELLPPPAEQSHGSELFVAPPDLGDPWAEFAHPLFAEPWFSHSDPNDPHRHIGIGQPLVGTSWRNRPWFFGTFVGGVMLEDLISNRIYQNDTTFIGARLGLDFDHFWGLEARTAFARADLADPDGAPINPASRNNFGDISLAYYPLGDACWRPYFSAGLGFTTFRFNDDLGRRVSEAALAVPLGIGVKYYYGPWFTLRFDLTDNIAIGNERISSMHNISLVAGAEFRFGGRRPSYFPWHNNTTYW